MAFSQSHCAPAAIPSHAAWNAGTTDPVNHDATPAAVSLMNPQAEPQIWRPSSVFVKNRTSAPTRAATPAITRPIGFAVIAAFHSHCAAVCAFVQTSCAFCAAVDASMATRLRTMPTVIAFSEARNVVLPSAAPVAMTAWYRPNALTPTITAPATASSCGANGARIWISWATQPTTVEMTGASASSAGAIPEATAVTTGTSAAVSDDSTGTSAETSVVATEPTAVSSSMKDARTEVLVVTR